MIKRGTQVSGNGHIFETEEDIDFAEPFSTDGIPNRKIIPNYSANNNIVSYTVIKREIVKSGASKIYKQEIGINETRPFHSVILPDDNVLSVDSVIVKEGSFSLNPRPNEFLDLSKRFFEVESLADGKIFIETDTTGNGIKIGKWLKNTRRFISEYTNKGFMKLTFGGSTKIVNLLEEVSASIDNIDDQSLNSISEILNNDSLGESLKSGTTLFVRYRIGGGESSNVAANTITALTNVDMVVNGPNPTYNAEVSNTLTVTNPIPAFGGRAAAGIEEIRQLIKYNYTSQNRGVTLKDYFSLIGKMPGKFGAPYRYNVTEEQNKIVVNIISKDSNNHITSKNPIALVENITEYLSEYRMINDYVVVKSGKVFNLGLDIDVMVQKNVSSSQVISEVIRVVTEYFDPAKFNMGDDIYISNLYEQINNVNGVLNVIGIIIENKFGGQYSDDETNFYVTNSSDRKLFELHDQTLMSEGNSMFEIRFPERDIRVRVK